MDRDIIISALKAVADRTVTNKESMHEILNLANDIEEITKELRFQANQAKRDPDEAAQALLDSTIAELFKLERLIEKARKTLDI